MTDMINQKVDTYDILDYIKIRSFKKFLNGSKLQRAFLLFVCLICFLQQSVAQDSDPVSTVTISDFMVSEIVNNPETMNIDGYYMELTISSPELLSSLVFEVEKTPFNGEPENHAYPIEILQKDDGVYLVVQHNHFRIENGQVKMDMTVEPDSLVDNTKYKITGFDSQGFTIKTVEFSHFQ